MTKIKIPQLKWDEWNLEHIKKHSVSQHEAENAIINISAHKKGYKGRIILIGRSGTRILSLIIAKESEKYYIITVRDADKAERGLLYEKEKDKNS